MCHAIPERRVRLRAEAPPVVEVRRLGSKYAESWKLLSRWPAGARTAAIARRIFAISCLEPIRLGVFLPATQLFQGHSVARALQKARDETLGATWRSWSVFTVPLFVGFRYLRPENRVPLLSAVGACWTTYLSWLAST